MRLLGANNRSGNVRVTTGQKRHNSSAYPVTTELKGLVSKDANLLPDAIFKEGYYYYYYFLQDHSPLPI